MLEQWHSDGHQGACVEWQDAAFQSYLLSKTTAANTPRYSGAFVAWAVPVLAPRLLEMLADIHEVHGGSSHCLHLRVPRCSHASLPFLRTQVADQVFVVMSHADYWAERDDKNRQLKLLVPAGRDLPPLDPSTFTEWAIPVLVNHLHQRPAQRPADSSSSGVSSRLAYVNTAASWVILDVDKPSQYRGPNAKDPPAMTHADLCAGKVKVSWCTCQRSRRVGLPCVCMAKLCHELRLSQEQCRLVVGSHVHQHWRVAATSAEVETAALLSRSDAILSKHGVPPTRATAGLLLESVTLATGSSSSASSASSVPGISLPLPVPRLDQALRQQALAEICSVLVAEASATPDLFSAALRGLVPLLDSLPHLDPDKLGEAGASALAAEGLQVSRLAVVSARGPSATISGRGRGGGPTPTPTCGRPGGAVDAPPGARRPRRSSTDTDVSLAARPSDLGSDSDSSDSDHY